MPTYRITAPIVLPVEGVHRAFHPGDHVLPDGAADAWPRWFTSQHVSVVPDAAPYEPPAALPGSDAFGDAIAKMHAEADDLDRSLKQLREHIAEMEWKHTEAQTAPNVDATDEDGTLMPDEPNAERPSRKRG